MNYLTRKIFTREGFLTLVIVGFSGFVGAVMSLPIIAYMIGPIVNEPKDVYHDARLVDSNGTPQAYVSVDTITIGKTEKVTFINNKPLSWGGSTDKNGAWLRRTGQQDFIAYSIFCTHLGCPIKWLGDANIFLCPCHGSVFNSDGTVAGGPAPQSLFQYKWRVDPKTQRVQIKTQNLPVAT